MRVLTASQAGSGAPTCSKIRYPDEAAAWVALFAIALGPPWLNGHKPVRAYRCRPCGCWHLTSQGDGK